MTERRPSDDAPEIVRGQDVSSNPAVSVVHQYYGCFNERRFIDVAALVAEDAVLHQLPVQRQERGWPGYLQFVTAWLSAFPDALLTVHQITSRDSGTFDVALSLGGTHRGALGLEGWVFRPTGVRVAFGLREVLELQNGKIAFSSVTCNLHEIVDQLAKIDVGKLVDHIERLRQLADALRALSSDSARARDITREIGRELDAARHVARPYYAPRGRGSQPG